MTQVQAQSPEHWQQLAVDAYCLRYSALDQPVQIEQIGTSTPAPTHSEFAFSAQAGKMQSGRVAIDFTIRDRNNKALSHTVWLKISTRIEAWVYRQNLPANTRIEAGHLQRKQILVDGSADEFVSIAAAPIGSRLKTAVRKDRPLMQRDVMPEPMVARLSPVKLIFDDGNIRLATKAIALADGYHANERIPVQVNGANASIFATISAPGEVHVAP